MACININLFFFVCFFLDIIEDDTMTKPSSMLYVVTVSYLGETYFKHRSGYKDEDFVGSVAFESIFLLLCL